MTPTNLPTPNPNLPPPDDAGATSRQLLAPLYGQAPTLDLGEAAQFEAVRDTLVDWAEDATDAELSAPARTALLDRAFADQKETIVSPIGGAVWVRRGGKGRPLALASRFSVLPNDLLILPTGTRAEVRLPDGSSILLKEHTHFVVGGPRARNQGQLLAGRLYAWVEHQVRTAFRIATPLGTAAVLGTQFDLDLEEPRRIQLLVTKGKVEFTMHKGQARGTSQIVSHNRLFTGSIQDTTLRRLSPLEVRRHTAWVHGRNPRRGRSSFFGLFILVCIIAVAAFWYSKKNKPQTGEKSWAITQKTALENKTAPLNLASMAFEPGKSWRVRGTSYKVDGAGAVSGPPLRKLSILSQTSTASPPTRPRVELLTEEFLVDGDHVREYAGLRGTRFEYELAADGAFSSFRTPGSNEPLTGTALDVLGGAITMSGAASLGPPGRRTPGEKWSCNSSLPIPGIPQSRIQIATQYHFEGYTTRNGAERAVVRETSVTDITGPFHWGSEAKPPLTIDIYLDHLRAITTGVYFIDPSTGRVVDGEFWNQTTETDGHLDMKAPGRPTTQQPIRQRNQTPSLTRFDVEYPN